MKKYIGFSLSFCVFAILRGKMKQEDIIHIYTGTAFPCETGTLAEEAVAHYWDGGMYWTEYPREEVLALIETLTPIITQLRLIGAVSPRIATGVWLNIETQEYTR
jgi:hypothetical protein